MNAGKADNYISLSLQTWFTPRCELLSACGVKWWCMYDVGKRMRSECWKLRLERNARDKFSMVLKLYCYCALHRGQWRSLSEWTMTFMFLKYHFTYSKDQVELGRQIKITQESMGQGIKLRDWCSFPTEKCWWTMQAMTEVLEQCL